MHKRRESPHYRPPMDRLIEKITNKNVKNHLAMIRQLIDCLLFYIFTTPFSVCLFFFLRKRFGGVCAVRGRPRRKNLFFFLLLPRENKKPGKRSFQFSSSTECLCVKIGRKSTTTMGNKFLPSPNVFRLVELQNFVFFFFFLVTVCLPALHTSVYWPMWH